MILLFHGHCPICRKQLLVDDEPSSASSCYCPEGHYSCQAKDFDQLWDDFNAQVERLGMDVAVAVYAGKLLKDLRSLNLLKRAKAR